MIGPRNLLEHEGKTLGKNKVPGCRESDTDDDDNAVPCAEQTGPSILRAMTVARNLIASALRAACRLPTAGCRLLTADC